MTMENDIYRINQDYYSDDRGDLLVINYLLNILEKIKLIRKFI